MLFINPFSEKFRNNPYSIYNDLRRESPVHWQKISEQNSFWFISKYEDVDSILKDNRFVREYKTVFPESNWQPPKEQKELFEVLQSWVLFKDPPAHTRLRKLISGAFQKLLLKADIEAIVLKQTQNLTANFSTKNSVELMHDFAIPLPVMVFAELLGLPPDEWEKLKKWSDLIVASFDISKTPDKDKNIGNEIVVEMKNYFTERINQKRKNPKNDLISLLISAENNGEKLSEHELMANIIFLLGAGHETTTNLIGNGIFALLKNPTELNKLKNNPALIDNAIEEFLRYESPIKMTFRIASEDIEIKGNKIAKGQQVALLLGSANHDPNQFENPEILNITRKNSNRHLAFASGIHYCVGANLAKMEAKIAIQTLINQYSLELNKDENDIIWVENPSFKDLKKFYVSFNS